MRWSVMASHTIGSLAAVADATGVMAAQAPAHRERHLLPDAHHLLDQPVTRLTRNRGLDVPLMIEMDEVGQVVHLHPPDSPPLQYGLTQLLNLRRLRRQQAVAVHTHACRRNSGMLAPCRGVMAIQAGNPRLPRMEAVRERNRLCRAVPLIDADAGDGVNDDDEQRRPRHNRSEYPEFQQRCRLAVSAPLPATRGGEAAGASIPLPIATNIRTPSSEARRLRGLHGQPCSADDRSTP